MSFKERGVWFSHRARALKMADAPQPHTSDEFFSLDEEERREYFGALAATDLPGSLETRAMQPEWEEAFGFNYIEANLVVSMGETSSHPLQPIYLEGAFEEDVIRQRLVDLGYQERAAGGRTYHAILGDYEWDLTNPASRLGTSIVNRLFVGDGILIGAPATDIMTNILEAWAGAQPSLAADPAYSSLARALGDPLSAGIVRRQQVLQSESVRPVRYDKPEDWGMLHHWDTFGVGYSQADDGSSWVDFSIFYPDLDAAEADAEELVHRMNGYKTAVPAMWPDSSREFLDHWPEEPVDDMCEALTATALRQDNGSTLTIRCPLAEGPQSVWWMLVDFRDFGFLLP